MQKPASLAPPTAEPRLDFRKAWSRLDRDYRTLLLALLVFTLGNSAAAFLLLRLADAGGPPGRDGRDDPLRRAAVVQAGLRP